LYVQGWSSAAAADMNYFYNVVVSQDERSCVESLEPFDEYEEWHLKCAHYVLLSAFNGLCRRLAPRVWPQLPSCPAEVAGDSFNPESLRNVDSDCGAFVAMSKRSPTSGFAEQLDRQNACEAREPASSDAVESSEMQWNQSPLFQDTDCVCVSTLPRDGPRWKAVELTFIGDEMDSKCQRFGHTADVLVMNGQRHVVMVGGFGVASCGRHRRLSDVTIWNLSTMASASCSVDSGGLLARVCHATVMLGNSVLGSSTPGSSMIGSPVSDNSSLVVVGGRHSPASPVQEYVISVDFDSSLLSADSVSCHAVVCSGDVPDATWRHTVVHAAIDGALFIGTQILGGGCPVSQYLDISCCVTKVAVVNALLSQFYH